MKRHHLWIVIATMVVAVIGLMLSRTALSLAPASGPEVIASNGIRYVSGGVGQDEFLQMQTMAKDYPLEVFFIQRHTSRQEMDRKEEYLADVNVKIQDRHLNLILNTSTEGPYLLVDLLPPVYPADMYLITADYKGDVKQQWVYIHPQQHQRVLFWWPIRD